MQTLKLDFTGEYDLEKTLMCGQFFRAKQLAQGCYQVVSQDNICQVQREGTSLLVTCEQRSGFDALGYWSNFLNVGDSWQPTKEMYIRYPWLEEVQCAASGLRLLRQDPWECLLGFIISQRNNIARITYCVEQVANYAGKRIDSELYALPEPEVVKPSCLLKCGLGYRESYIYAAADMVTRGELNLKALCAPSCSVERARQELLRVPGVGIKVANCVMLFSLGHGSCCPVDVWIERALKAINSSLEDLKGFGDHTGLVQEWLYYWIMHKV